MTRNSLLIEVSGYIEETEISANNIDNRTRENPPQFLNKMISKKYIACIDQIERYMVIYE